jgi:hypothetical protein
MANYRLELPINGTSYVLLGHQDGETGRILLDIAVQAGGDAAPAPVGSLAVPPDHLTNLARALPRVLRDLAAAFPSQQRHAMAAIKTKYPRAYEPWRESEQQQLREAFNPDAPNLAHHLEELADRFQRQPSAIRSRLQRLGLLPS